MRTRTLRDEPKPPPDQDRGGRARVGLLVAASPVGEAIGRIIELGDDEVVLERVTGASAEDGWMSRLQATVWLAKDGRSIVLRDGSRADGTWKSSANGTWMGERQLDEPVTLAPGERFRTGHTLWMVVSGPSPMPPGTLLVGVSPGLGRSRDELELVTSQMAWRLAHGQRVTQALLVIGPRGSGKQAVAAEARRLLVSKRHPHKVPFRHVAAPALADGTTAADLFGVVDGYATGVKGRPGYFEQAHGGVLLLDEVADTPLADQAKLLAALQEREVLPLGGRRPVRFDCLIIGATNRDVRTLVEQKHLRDDLLDRLSRFVIRLDPLDDRKEDIPVIAHTLLRRHGFSGTVAWDAMEALIARSYAGSVRELDTLVERMVATAQTVGLTELDLDTFARATAALEIPAATDAWRTGAQAPAPRRSARACPPRGELLAALESSGWNKTEVGRRYGKHPRQVGRWMEYLGIETPG